MENQKEKEFTTISNKLLNEVGLKPTLLLQNIIYRCNRYKVNNYYPFFEDNIYWDVISIQRIHKSMTIKKGFSPRQIKRDLDKLCEKGFIRKRKPFASCNWYAPTEKLIEFLGDEYFKILNDENCYSCYDYKIYDRDYYSFEIEYIEDYKIK